MLTVTAGTVDQECGLYAESMEGGYQHPFCSKTCARRSNLRPPGVLLQVSTGSMLCQVSRKFYMSSKFCEEINLTCVTNRDVDRDREQ